MFNAVGHSVPLGQHLAVARAVAGHTGPVIPAPEAWLLERGVSPWMGARSLPLWLPGEETAGFGARSNAAALAAGWKRFAEHPDWKKLREVKKYIGTVSKIHKSNWEPKPYSQL